jgi:hypothetical protein
MGIVDRVQDAELLRDAGRREGALMSVLVAFAATARRVHPAPATDRDAFEGLFRDTVNLDLEVEFRGTAWPVETILYKWLRCELVHEGGLPVDIDFVDDGDGALPMIGGAPAHGVLRLGNGWYDLLLRTVVTHPVNADLFTWRQDWLEAARASASAAPLGQGQ